MKRKLMILSGGLLATVALSAVVFSGKTQDIEKSLLLRNVEALANAESNDRKEMLVNTGNYCDIVDGSGKIIGGGTWWECRSDPNGSTCSGGKCGK